MSKKEYIELLYNESMFIDKLYIDKDKYNYSNKLDKLQKLTASSI